MHPNRETYTSIPLDMFNVSELSIILQWRKFLEPHERDEILAPCSNSCSMRSFASKNASVKRDFLLSLLRDDKCTGDGSIEMLLVLRPEIDALSK